jgi:hypothetical protein
VGRDRAAGDHRLPLRSGVAKTPSAATSTSCTVSSNAEDAKTEAGIRKVDLSPTLRENLLAWSRALRDPRPDGPFFPTRAGTRRDKDNINARVLRPAIRRADARVLKRRDRDQIGRAFDALPIRGRTSL